MNMETMEKLAAASPNKPLLLASAPGGGASAWDWAAGPVGAAIGPLCGPPCALAGERPAGRRIAARTRRRMAAACLIIEKPFCRRTAGEGVMRADLGRNLTGKIKCLRWSRKAQGYHAPFRATVAAC